MQTEPRRLSIWLVAGMLTMPGLFVWLLLRRGYSRQVRIGGFLLAAFVICIGALRELLPY